MNNVKDIVLDIIGPYEPVSTTSSSVSISTDGFYIDPGSFDFPWIFSAILFIVFVSGFLACLRAFVSGFAR